MKVWIKELNCSMEVKNRGVEFEVYDSEGQHLGDLVVTKAKVVWCKGRTTVQNGKALTWKKFIALMNQQ